MACLHCRRSERCNRSWMSLILTGMSEGWTSVKEPTQFNRLVTLPLVTECESLLLLSEPDMMYFRRKKSIVFPRFSGFDTCRFKWLLTLFPIAWCRRSPWQQPYKGKRAHTTIVHLPYDFAIIICSRLDHAGCNWQPYEVHVQYVPDFMRILEIMNWPLNAPSNFFFMFKRYDGLLNSYLWGWRDSRTHFLASQLLLTHKIASWIRRRN